MINDEPTTRKIYNPSLEDIVTWTDKYGENPEEHTLRAGEFKEFPIFVADIIEQKLIDRMLWQNLPENKNKEKAVEALRKLIRV